MTLIPRSEIDAIMDRYGDFWSGRNDLPVTAVRKVARHYRAEAGQGAPTAAALQAEADDLDALADRYEAAA